MRTWNSVATTQDSPVDVPLQAPEVSVPQLVTGYSIEATPKQLESVASLANLLPAGTSVYVPFLPKADFADTVVACRRIAAEGLRPVPHVAVRAVPSLGMLSENFRMLADEGVDSLLLIAGDRRQAAGPFQSTLAVFDSGLLQRYGFDKVGVAGHPEGHPDAGDDVLMDALRRKARYAADTGTEMWIVTQFAFSAEPLVNWLDRLRARGIQLPVRAGLPGPAKVQTLLRYAAQCGIGGSARMLARRPDALTRLLGRWTPDDMLAMLARSATFRGEQMTGVHIFPFGGFMQSVEYFNALSADAARR